MTADMTADEGDALASSGFGAIGRRRFLQGVGAAAGAGVLAAVVEPGVARALPAGASRFVPLPTPTRILDTREPWKYEFVRHAANHVSLPVTGRYGVPTGASAVVATVTAVNLDGGNWVSVLPSGSPISDLLAQERMVSALNFTFPGEASANLCQIKIGGGGVDIYSRGPCEMIFDLLGYYMPTAVSVSSGRFVPLPSAQRAIDTRDSFGFVQGGDTLVVDVTPWVPADASSVVVNLTVTETTAPGYFTAYPFHVAERPPSSTLNVNGSGEIRAAACVIGVATQADNRRYIKVFALAAAKIIVDIVGSFTGSSSPSGQAGLFVPVDPVRILDTRRPGQIGRMWPGWVVEGAIPGAGAAEGSAAVVNLTAVASRASGYLTIAAARVPLPGTSNLNFVGANRVVPNHSITPITTTFGYQVFASSGGHVLVDYAGYYLGAPSVPRISAPVNPPPPPAGPPWVLSVPAIGLTSTVRGGNGPAIADAGYSWHWTGTGYMGQEANVAMFAHRTSSGGPYRYLHYLAVGDYIVMRTGDAREYVYQVVRRDLTDSNTAHILDATRFHPGTTVSLIACSRPDFTPTSLSWRIVVTAALVDWYELQ